MLNYSDIRASLRDWLVSCAPDSVRQVIYSNPDAPRPPRPFVTLLVSSITGIGQPFYGDSHGAAGLAVYDDVAIMVSLQAFGDDAQQIMSTIRSSIRKPSKLNQIREAGMAFIRDTGIRDLTELGKEQRAGMDIEVRALDEIIDDIGFIESVEVAGIAGTREVQFTAGV